MDLATLRERFAGREFDSKEFSVDAQDAVTWARACGETEARYLDPSHSDFQAPPTFSAMFVGGRTLPEDYPRDAFANSFDAGKCVTVHAPIRPGERIVGRSQIADFYEKTGRSGPMLFMVHRMEFFDAEGTLVSAVDWRLVQRSAPEEA